MYQMLYPPGEMYIKPEVGKLMVFPSWLKHGTKKTQENSPRISISGDIIMTAEKNKVSVKKKENKKLN